MIACPGARREEAAQLHNTQDFHEKGTSFSTSSPLKPRVSSPSGGILLAPGLGEDSVQSGGRGGGSGGAWGGGERLVSHFTGK